MTQKEKIIKSFMTVQNILHTAQIIEKECKEYSSTAASYAKDIVNKCESLLQVL